MKPVSPELLAILGNREYFQADLYTFSGGNLGTNVLRYTSADQDITWMDTYSSGGLVGPYFDRKDNKAKIHWKGGTEADTLSFVVSPGSSTIMGVSWQQAVKYGVFDGAQVSLSKAFMVNFGDTRPGVVPYFLGRVTSIDSGRSMLSFNAATYLELLNLQLPRNVYQSTCRNNLGDAACGVNLATYTFPGTIANNGSNNSFLNINISTTWSSGSPYNFGKVVMTSGALNGFSATIGYVTEGSPTSLVALLSFLPGIPAMGDTCNLTYGCDKTLGIDGCPKFANTARYRAERLIPLPATAA